MAQEHTKPRCCPKCRLVQPVADTCRGCGGGAPGRLKRRRGAFFSGPPSGNRNGSTVASVVYIVLTAAWLGGMYLVAESLGIDRRSPAYVFFPFVIGGGLVFCVFGLVAKLLVESIAVGGPTKPRLAPRFVKLPPALLAGQGPTFAGAAAASNGKVSAFLRPEECLAAFLMVGRTRDGSLFLRGVRGAGFLVQRPTGDPLFVTGNMWIVGEPKGATSTTHDGISALGFDPDRFFEGDGPGHTMELVLREGDEVEVTGHESREPVPGLALGYRDSGAVVLRGTPQEPVLVHLKSPG